MKIFSQIFQYFSQCQYIIYDYKSWTIRIFKLLPNIKMPKETIRTSEQKEYRKKLAEKLHMLRASWDEWREIAKVLLSKEQESDEYINAKNWLTKKQLSERLDSLLSWWFISGEVYETIELMKKENIELSNQQKQGLKKGILKLYDWSSEYDREYALSLLIQNFKQFSQEEKEELLMFAMKNYCLRTEQFERKNPFWKGLYKKIDSWEERGGIFTVPYNPDRMAYYTVYTAGENINPMIIKTLKKSNNETFILEALAFFQRWWYLSISDIPENCISILSDPQRLKHALESYKSDTKYIIIVLDKLWIKISLDELSARQYGRKKYEASWNGNVYDSMKSVFWEKFIDTVINKWWKDLELLIGLLWKEKVRDILDDKYKTPSFVNTHIKELEPLLKGDWWIYLLESTSIQSEKFDIQIIKSDFYKDIEKVDTYNYVIDLVKKHTNLLSTSPDVLLQKFRGFNRTKCVPAFEWCYPILKEIWNIPERFYTELFENSCYAKDFLRMYWSEIIQAIYATHNHELLMNLWYSLYDFSGAISDEEHTIAVKKIIAEISNQEEFNKFYENYLSRSGRWICQIIDDFFRGWNYTEKEIEYINRRKQIPWNLYKKFIQFWIIKTWNEYLPEVWPSIEIDTADIVKLIKYYDQMNKDAQQSREKMEEELKRQEAEKKRFEEELINNREKWDVICIYTRPDQKFVLSVDNIKSTLQFLSEDLDYHYNIHSKYIKDWKCLWWGRIKMDESKNTIELYWYSESYWSVPDKYKGPMRKMLEKKYPGYKIIVK